MFNLEILLTLCLLLLIGNLWFMVSYLKFSRMVETKLREALANKRR